MKAKKKNGVVEHTGSTFDSFLEEEGIREEVEAVAVKRVISWQLAEAMRKKKKTKQALAKELNTSRSQLDRLLRSAEYCCFSGHDHPRCQGTGQETDDSDC